MAIGSDPEIGSKFVTGAFTSEESQAAWFEQMRSWGPDLLGGYGTLCFPSDAVRLRINMEQEAIRTSGGV